MPAKELPVKPVLADEDFFPSLEGEYNPPPRSHKKLWIVLGAIAFVAIAAGLYWSYSSRPAPPSFQFATLERGPIDATISATGTLNAVVDVQVGSQVSGNIKELYADFNTRVKKGQLVALIDPAPFQAAVQQAQASVNAAQAAVVTAQANLAKAQSDKASSEANVANQQANLTKAKSAVDLAKAQYDRENELYSDKVVAKQDLDTAKATYDEAVASQAAAQATVTAAQATAQSSQKQIEASQNQVQQAKAVEAQDQASLSQAQLNLAHTRIVAPVDGTVIARKMDVGQTVAASFQAPEIFEIAQDLTKMQVDTNVAESDVGHLKVGQPATFSVDAFPGTVFHGVVEQIREAPINVQNVITYDAVVRVDNPELKLFPGMTANVTIQVDHRDNVLRIPNAALRLKPPPSVVQKNAGENAVKPSNRGEQSVVYVPAANSMLHAVPVQTGISDANYTELVQGDLKAGQRVVVGVSTPEGEAPQARSPRMPRRF